MKRLFSTLAVITMAFGLLTGCGASNTANNESAPADTKSSETTTVNEASSNEADTETDTADTKKIIDCSGTEVEIPTNIYILLIYKFEIVFSFLIFRVFLLLIPFHKLIE